MLLQEYLTEIGVVGYGRNREGATQSSMHLISHFEFGKFYRVVLHSGAKIEFSSFSVAIGILRDELQAAPGYAHALCRDRDVLYIGFRNELGRVWGRSVKQLVQEVTLAVTEYNMTEKWNEDIPLASVQLRRSPWW